MGHTLCLGLRLTRTIDRVPLKPNIAQAPLHNTTSGAHSTFRVQQFLAIYWRLTNRFLWCHPLDPYPRLRPPLSRRRAVKIHKTLIRRASSAVYPNHIFFEGSSTLVLAAHSHAPARAEIRVLLNIPVARAACGAVHRRRVGGAVEEKNGVS